MKKIKVLICINSIRRGGMEISAITYQQNMDSGEFEFTYYVRDSKNIDKDLLKSIIDSKATVVYKPIEVKTRLKEYRWIKSFILKNKYEVIHSHMQYHSGLILKAAYKAGVQKRVSHSHFTKDNRKIGFLGSIYRRIMRLCLNRYASERLACSMDAGQFLYGKSFYQDGILINNGIDMTVYRFNESIRKQVRSRMNMEDKLVVGHVGSIYWIKNQTFLIRVFREICKRHKNAVLILCGEICDDGESQKLSEELNLKDRIKFLGVRNDIPELLMAMDILIFPSVFEALPIVPIEAQATGLPCLLSDKVSADIKKIDIVEYLSLNETPEKWAEKAMELIDHKRGNVNMSELVKFYDIKNIAKQLENIYKS